MVDQAPEHPSLHAEPFAREPLCLVVPHLLLISVGQRCWR
nr:hypothetical protein [Edwardsiella piscicida]